MLHPKVQQKMSGTCLDSFHFCHCSLFCNSSMFAIWSLFFVQPSFLPSSVQNNPQYNSVEGFYQISDID